MKKEQFVKFWELHSKEWYSKRRIKTVKNNEVNITPVNSLCKIKEDCSEELYNNYDTIKRTIKDLYFKEPTGKLLSRYKRAAVFAYTILLSDPLIFNSEEDNQLDKNFLKQRLAFYIAICSIVQDFPENEVKKIARQQPLFNFTRIDEKCHEGDDNFLMSVYKDMFFSELYGNYNVLTMANVFGLLTELGSPLSNIKTIEELETIKDDTKLALN